MTFAFFYTSGSYASLETYPSQALFGESLGFEDGAKFKTREELQNAGLHRNLISSISWENLDGANAVIVPSGFGDDIDDGDLILYTGEGGRARGAPKQTYGQNLDQGNRALVASCDQMIPIRVIRESNGHPRFSPSEGFRYDGMYLVEEYFAEKSADGFRIFRFVLRKIGSDSSKSWTRSLDNTNEPFDFGSPPRGVEKPERVSSSVDRIVRNTPMAQKIKKLYDFQCQFCGTNLMTASGPYAEGAHIKPLGVPHDGPDTWGNLLCLCANCHVLFDRGAIYLADDPLRFYSTYKSEPLGTVNLHRSHSIDMASVRYHREKIADQGEP